MRIVDIIRKKRDGHELTAAEIEFVVSTYTADQCPDYQMAAWLMAVVLRGMTPRGNGRVDRRHAALRQVLDLLAARRKVDKHSTGGVGDKTSLIMRRLSPRPAG